MNKNLADNIYSLISPITSKYIEHLNISSETFAEAIKSGKLSLENLTLTNDVILDLNNLLMLTLKINSIKLDQLTINTPQITNLMKTSVVIELKGIKISAELPFYNREKISMSEIKNYIDELLFKNKFEFIERLKKEIPASLEKKNSKGFFNFDYTNLMMSIVDNIIVKISEIEINIDNIAVVEVGKFEYFSTDSKFDYVYGKFNKDNYMGFKSIKLENISVEIFGQRPKELCNDVLENERQKRKFIESFDVTIRLKIQRALVKNNISSNFKTDLECEFNVIKYEVNIIKDYIETFSKINDHLKNLSDCMRTYEILKKNLNYNSDYYKFSNNIVDKAPQKSINCIKWRWAMKCILDLKYLSKTQLKSINNKIEEEFLAVNSKIFMDNVQKEFETFFPLIKAWSNLFSNQNEPNSSSNELKDLKSLLLLLDSFKISQLIQPFIEEIIINSKSKKEDKGFFNMFSLGSQKTETVVKTSNISLSKEEKEEISKEIKDNLAQKNIQSINSQFKIRTEIKEINLNIFDQHGSLFRINLHGIYFSLMILPNKAFTAEMRLKSLNSSLSVKKANCENKIEIIRENINNQHDSFAFIFDIKNEPEALTNKKIIKLNSVIEKFDIVVNYDLVKLCVNLLSDEPGQILPKKIKNNLYDNSKDLATGSDQLLTDDNTFDINLLIKSREIRIYIKDITNCNGSLNARCFKEDFLSIITNDTQINFKGEKDAKNVFSIKTGLINVKKSDKINKNDKMEINNYPLNPSITPILENLNLNISIDFDKKNKFIDIRFSQLSDATNQFALYASIDLLKSIKSLKDLFQSLPCYSKNLDNAVLIDSASSLPIKLYKESLSKYEISSTLQLQEVDIIFNLSSLNRAIFRTSEFKTKFNLNNFSSFKIMSEIHSIESIYSEDLGLNQQVSNTSLYKSNLLLCKFEIEKDKSINVESLIDNIKINYDCSKLREITSKLIEIISFSRDNFSNKTKISNFDYKALGKDYPKFYKSFDTINFHFFLKKISLNLSQDLLDYEFQSKELTISVEQRVNQINLNFEISKIFLYDLTDYPYSFNDMVNKSFLIAIEEKFKMNLTSIFNFETKLNIELKNPYFNFVKQPMERFLLFIMKDIKNWENEFYKLNLILNSNENNDADWINESGFKKCSVVSSFKNKPKMDHIIFEINLKNITVEIKASYKFEDSLTMNFGEIEIHNHYSKENQKNSFRKIINSSENNFTEKKENFDLMKVELTSSNFFICSQINSKEKFYLLLPLNGTMKISYADNFLCCELTMKKLEINLRQIDLNYLFKCIDLNFSFDDKILKKINPDKMRKNEKDEFNFILNTTEIKINLLGNTKKELDINSHKEILTSLHLNNLILNILSTTEGENSLHEINFKIKLMEIYYYLLENSSKSDFDLIMSYNFDSNSKQNTELEKLSDQVLLLIRINTKNANSTKLNLDLNHIKFNPRLDFIIMLKTFFENSFPDYDDEDQETNPNKSKITIKDKGTKLIQSELEINLKNTLFTLCTDENQSHVDKDCYVAVIGLLVKDIKLININKDTDTIRRNLETIKSLAWDSVNISNLTLKENFSEIFLELKSIDIFTYLGNHDEGLNITKSSQLNKRYILKQNSADSLLVIKSSLYMHFNERFEIKESMHVLIELHRLLLKLSYKDILSFVKVGNKMYREISSEEFKNRLDQLKGDTSIRKLPKNINLAMSMNNIKEMEESNSFGLYLENVHLLLNGYKISFILIDDQDNVYYPFLTANIDNLNNSLLIRNGEGKLKLISLSEIEILSHNYIAGEWEPVVENLRAELTYSREAELETDNKVNILDENNPHSKDFELATLSHHRFIKSNLVLNIQANNLSTVNINLSDRNISFIYSNMSSWIKKLLKELEYYNNSIINLNDPQNHSSRADVKNLPTIISNHKIKNLSGRNLLIKYGSSSDCAEILLRLDECIDLEYIPESEKNRKITLDFGIEKDNRESHLIFVDQLGSQFHSINFNLAFNNLKQTNNSYLISEVTSLNKRRLITIYSPIVFYNKTENTFLLNLINYDPISKKDVEYILVLGSREKQAIPYEFLTANYELQNPMTSTKSEPHKLRDILDRPDHYNKEIVVGNAIYNLNRKLKKSLKNVREIKITSSYSIVNCLPCDLKVILSGNREKFVLQKSERKYINSLSLKNSLNVHIEAAGFESPKGIGVVLYDNFGNLDESNLEKIKLMRLERINANTNTNLNVNSLPNLNLNNSLVLSYCLLKNKMSQNREIVVYSSNIFINKSNISDLKLFYDTKREITKYNSEGSKEEVFLYNNNPAEDTKFFLELNSAQSSYIDINNIKENTNLQVSCYGKNLLYEFVIQASLSSLPSLNFDSELYSYMLTINPSLIVHNNLENFNISICLKSDQMIYDTIQNKQSLPFNFFANSSGKSSQICLKPVIFDEHMNDISIGYQWSEPFCIQNRRGLFTIPITISNEGSLSGENFQSTNKKMYLNCEIKEENLITHLEISMADYNNSQFIIENCMSNNFENILEDESYVVKISQEKNDTINTEYILEGNFAIFSLFENLIATKQNSNFNRIMLEIFVLHKNFLKQHEISFEDQYLLEQIINKTSPRLKLKFQIFDDGIKKENLAENSNAHQSTLLPYPYHHEDTISSGKKIKILFLSNGIKKTIKFLNNTGYNKNKHGESEILPSTNLSFYKNVFNLDLFIENLSISIISDNSFRDKKLRYYSRSEIMHILINNITSTYKKETFNWEDNKDQSELNFSIYDIQIDNQTSTSAKFPNVLKIARQENFSNNQKASLLSFFSLNIFSEVYSKDNMSMIKFLSYNIEPVKIGIDVEFIEALLLFTMNLFYQLNTSYISVDEVLKKRDEKNSDPVRSIRQSKSGSGYKYFANLLESSNVTFIVSICEKGLKEFLFRHLNVGSFLSSLINNLTVDETKILLSGETVNYFLGSFNDIIAKIFIGYKQKFISRLFSIGAKGLFLGIIKIFSKEQIVPEIEPFMRMKLPRTFYGKYKQIKKYNPVHAYVSDLIRREKIKVFKNFEWNFYDCEIFEISKITKEEICLIFTTSNVILVNMLNMMPFYIIDYYSMGNIECDLGRNQTNPQVVIFFNQKVDDIDRYVIPCSDELIAKRVTDLIRDAKEVNRDEYYTL